MIYNVKINFQKLSVPRGSLVGETKQRRYIISSIEEPGVWVSFGARLEYPGGLQEETAIQLVDAE